MLIKLNTNSVIYASAYRVLERFQFKGAGFCSNLFCLNAVCVFHVYNNIKSHSMRLPLETSANRPSDK